ncbi:homocysteine S-methyltransferase family protein [Vagococcus sp.]|uniref:homocysteine S-methyltransferase family protein n=1 Tax=Vagococcus sp. TaxID=1933889 RepID=UPI002FCA0ACF
MKEIMACLENEILVFDGAMGTMLQKHNLPIMDIQSERFNQSHPEIVSLIHRSYVEAGSDILTTNTFQSNSNKLDSKELPSVIKQAVKLARSANPRFVAYDMGPIGKMMPPQGDLTFEEAYELFKEQAILAEEAGVDLVIIETMWDLREAKAAILAVKEHTELPVFVTMTFQKNGRTLVGTDALTAALSLQEYGADAIGVNCSFGPVELLPVVQTMINHGTVPIIVQANAGLPEIIDNKSVYRMTVEEYKQAVNQLLDLGVKVVGGCCGTTPEFIQAICQSIEGKGR